VVLSRSNMTRLIDRLEQAGLVGRERSEEDGRGSYAILTPAGKTQRARMWPVYKTAISTLFEAHLRPAEAHVMNLVLRRILVAARR
jgi:DNA-binding MarR family transcriptional regulator